MADTKMTENTLTGKLLNFKKTDRLQKQRKTFNKKDVLNQSIECKDFTDINFSELTKKIIKDVKDKKEYIQYWNNECYYVVDDPKLDKYNPRIRHNDFFDRDEFSGLEINLKEDYKEKMIMFLNNIIEDISKSSPYKVPIEFLKGDEDIAENETIWKYYGFLRYTPKGCYNGHPYSKCYYDNNIICINITRLLTEKSIQRFMAVHLEPFVEEMKESGNNDYDDLEKSNFFKDIVYINLNYPDGSRYDSNEVFNLGILICINIKLCIIKKYDIKDIIKDIVTYNTISFNIHSFYKHLQQYISGYPGNEKLWISKFTLVNKVGISPLISDYDKKKFDEDELSFYNSNFKEDEKVNWIDYLNVVDKLTINKIIEHCFYLENRVKISSSDSKIVKRIILPIEGIEELTIVDKNTYVEPKEPESAPAPEPAPEPESAPEPALEPEPEMGLQRACSAIIDTIAVDSDGE